MQTPGYEFIFKQNISSENYPAEAQLKYIAYTGQSELVHTIIRNAPFVFRESVRDKEILSQAIHGSIKRINNLKSVHNYELLKSEKQFLLKLIEQFRLCCEKNRNTPKEYFESVIHTSELLIGLNDLSTAYELLANALNNGVNKFPNLMADLLNKLSHILGRQGNIEKSAEMLHRLIYHPYFITDRNQIPEIFNSFSQAILKQGDIKFYKSILFTGLKYFYTNSYSRKLLFDQVIKTYKSIFKMLLSSDIDIINKVVVFTHWCYYKIPDFGKIKLSVINKLFDKSFLIVFYVLNYVVRKSSFHPAQNIRKGQLHLAETDSDRVTLKPAVSTSKKILITRAMGGIGDFLMMTPAIHALKKKHPKYEICLAIPKRYFPVFENNPDVNLIDIEEDFFTHSDFSKWHNLTDCPASRIETITAPRVKKNRIEIFAKEIGIIGLSYLNMYKRPRIIISDAEKKFANVYWQRRNLDNKKVICVQLHSDESYRNYPHMQNLIEKISRQFTVLVFDSVPIEGYNFENVIKIHSLPLRKVFSLIYKCDLVIAPDSSFVHIAAAFNLPTIALFGPIDGKLRTKDYPNCRYVDSRDELKCLPCWRNESIPCQLTGLRNSICMESISVNKIINELNKILKEHDQNIK